MQCLQKKKKKKKTMNMKLQRGARHAELSELETLVSGIDQISQSTLLLKKMKEMNEVDDSLEYMKEQYERRMANCVERQVAYEKRQAEMDEQVAKFQSFISDYDAKRLRAEGKAKTERAAYRAKCKEKEQLELELEATDKQRSELVAELSSLRKYQRYLEKTVEVSYPPPSHPPAGVCIYIFLKQRKICAFVHFNFCPHGNNLIYTCEKGE
jgi:hypothetical protein